jgi:hypothetical protein
MCTKKVYDESGFKAALLVKQEVSMDELGQLAQELGDVTFEAFISEARNRRLNAAAWLKAKQRGLLATYLDAQGVLRVVPPGGIPEQYRDVFPDRSIS